jgi:peptidoglycan hydrolase FlgJ
VVSLPIDASKADAIERVPQAIRMDAASGSASMPKAAGMDAPHKFEAYLLQSVFEQLLPRDSDSTFGSGFAGGVWRSMMAEHLANAVTAHGGFGIASKLSRQR